MDSQSITTLVILCIITHIIRTVYEILKHKKIVQASKLSFAIIFTNMALLWTSWFALCDVDTYKIRLPEFLRYFGLFLDVAGLILFLTSLFTIKTLETYNGDLITKGIYFKIRHPMYLGFICWLIGTPVFYGAVFSLALAVLFIANVLFWRHLEEIELEKRFVGYKEYKVKTIF